MEAVSYNSGNCKVKVSGMGSGHDMWKCGRVVIIRDAAGVWKIRVEHITSKTPILCNIRLHNKVQATSVNGTRFHVRLTHNGTNIYADRTGNCDTDYLDNVKTLCSILKKIQKDEDPSEILGLKVHSPYSTPSRKTGNRYDARDVAQIISSDSADDSIFNEPRDAFLSTMKSPASVRRHQESYSRKARILSRSLEETGRKNEHNKENASSPVLTISDEQENAKSFYGAPGTTPKRSGYLECIRTLPGRNIRLTPSRTIGNYTMKRPGLLPSPTPGRFSSSPIVSRPAVSNVLSSPPRLQGFSNIGNTCYMNAILQSLLSLTSFHWDLMYNITAYRSLPTNGLYLPLLRLCRLKAKGTKDQETLRSTLKTVKNAISSSAKRFSGYEQHDAHEFLAQVLDQLSEEVQAVEKKPSNVHRWINPTLANFETEVLHTITCLGCSATVSKIEQIYDMNVDLPQTEQDSPGSIQTAMENFLRPEKLEYKCEECNHSESEVSHVITKLPRILVIHLQRYSYDSTFQVNSKVGKPVRISRVVTLRSNCDRTTIPARTPENPELIKLLRNSATEFSDDEAVVPTVDHGEDGLTNPVDGFDRIDGIASSDIIIVTPSKVEDGGVVASVVETNRNSFRSNEKASDMTVNCDTMNEEEQIRYALELSMNEYQPMPSYCLPAAEDWLEDSPSKSSSLGSDLEKSNLPELLESVTTADTKPNLVRTTVTPMKITPKSDWVSPLGIKRRRNLSRTPSVKSRRTDVGKWNIVESSGSESDLGNQVRTMNGDHSTQEICRGSVGLKGGGRFSLPGDQGEKRCGMCNSIGAECSCDSDDAIILLTNDFPVVRSNDMTKNGNFAVEKECVCDLYRGTKYSWCHACQEKRKKMNTKTPESNSKFSSKKTPAKREASSSRAALFPNRPRDTSGADASKARNFDRKFDPKNSINWVLKTTERLDKEKTETGESEENNGDDASDNYYKQLEEAKKASLAEKELVTLSEEQLLQKALKASLLEQQDQETCDHDNDDDHDLREAVKASLDGCLSTEPVKKLNRSNLGDKRILTHSADDELSDVGEVKAKVSSTAERGPFSFVLVSVVSHVGATASSGHYVTEVYDAKKREWFSYDDSNVTQTTMSEVVETRRRNGYVFFYMAREVLDEIHAQLSHPLLNNLPEPEVKELTERSPNVRRQRSEKKEYSFVKTFS